MPIYEYYCPDNHTIYQFYAKTLAQGRTVPKCPQNPRYRMEKILSSFAVTSGTKDVETSAATSDQAPAGDSAEDRRMEAAMGAMEREFSGVDENDPRAMARMMRRMSELTGERIDGEMEEVVRKLEEGADPESLEEQLGGDVGADEEPDSNGQPGEAQVGGCEARRKFRVKRAAPARDPQLYDYE